MLNSKVQLITTLKNIESVVEDETFIFPIRQFVGVIQNTPNDCDIILTNNSIKVGDSINYSFEKRDDFVVQLKDASFYLNEINNSKFEILKLKDTKEAAKLKSYIGTEDVLSTFIFMNNKFIVSDNILTIIKSTENNSNQNVYFSKLFTDYLFALGKEEIEIYIGEKIYYMNVAGTYCIFPIAEKNYYIIPDLFSEKVRAIYEHKNTCIIMKSDLMNALNRISIVTRQNEDSRTFFTFTNNNLIVENKEGDYALEQVPIVSCDSELFDHNVVLSAVNVKNILSLLTGNQCIFYVLPDKKEARTIMVKDEIGNDVFIHTLFRY
jgi:hypothetical protein